MPPGDAMASVCTLLAIEAQMLRLERACKCRIASDAAGFFAATVADVVRAVLVFSGRAWPWRIGSSPTSLARSLVEATPSVRRCVRCRVLRLRPSRPPLSRASSPRFVASSLRLFFGGRLVPLA